MTPADLLNPPAHAVLKQSSRSTTFGTSKVVDLSDGQLPVVVVRVNVNSRTGVAEDGDSYNVRTEKQIRKRVGQLRLGWTVGEVSHVEIRNGSRVQE